MTHPLPELRHVYAHPFMDSGRWEGFEHRAGDVFICTSYKAGTTWMQILGAGFLGGIGFTMSLFISNLSFTEGGYMEYAKIGIMAGSLLSACCGYLILRFAKSNV